jgi:aryl-alcohol dehydrogenase-like predicted oxidoreductase
MRKRPLGKSPVSVSELCLGTWSLSGEARGQPLDRERFDDVVGLALDQGIETFDVSPLWADGEAERALGRVLGERRPPSAQVITRGGVRREGAALLRTWEADALIADCEASLRRLGRETIDVFLVQGLPDPAVDRDRPEGEPAAGEEGIEEAAALLTRDGKARTWGLVVETEDDVDRALGLGVDALCLAYNLVHPRVLEDLAERLATQDVGVLVRSPLGYGLLGGSWTVDTRFEEGDHRRERWPDPAAFEARLAQVDQLRFLVDEDARIESLAEAALRYVLRRPEVSGALIGPSTREQLVDLCRASVPEGEDHLPEAAATRVSQVLAALGL